MTGVCLDPLAACLCALPEGHEIEHRCECGGSWTNDERRFPLTAPGTGEPMTPEFVAEKMAEMMAFLFDEDF